MKKITASVLVGASAMLTSSAAALAQLSPMLPMDRPMPADPSAQAPAAPAADVHSMHMTPEEMTHTQSQKTMDALSPESHSPDLGLERPAESQTVAPPMMPGMDMDDAQVQHRIWLENIEGVFGTHNGGAWDMQGWVGGDFEKLWIKSEGATLNGKTQDAKVEALWAHAILPFWDTQLGVRHDFSAGPSREWAALGVQGISPYWLDIELTGYVGEEGRTAGRLKTEYDLYLTQHLILKPEVELNAYGKPDRAREIGAGLSDGQFELRLRYEFTRRCAPYVGYVYDAKFAGSASLARLSRDPAVDHRVVAGLELFF